MHMLNFPSDPSFSGERSWKSLEIYAIFITISLLTYLDFVLYFDKIKALKVKKWFTFLLKQHPSLFVFWYPILPTHVSTFIISSKHISKFTLLQIDRRTTLSLTQWSPLGGTAYSYIPAGILNKKSPSYCR